MSDRHQAALTQVIFPARVAATLRLLLGAAIGGASGMIAGLVIIHQAEKRDWGGNIGLARALGGARGAEGAGVAREGLYALIIAGTLIGLVVLTLSIRTLGRHWLVSAAVASVVIFLVWGLIYGPYADARLDDYSAGGVFGSAGGFEIVVVYAVAAVVYGIVAARVATVIADADFWVEKDNDIRAGLERLQEMGLVSSAPGSLELAEQRPEQGGEPTGTESGDRRP